ncbi:MAG: hypothetical protein U9N77_00895 [Thermodesulfobacteriota bacterium]|nr:hypothetical protein [Thermodesulfobacteriota bacterium]
MLINWKIKKKRGNHRPSLNYKIVLEDFEKKLAVPSIIIQSILPKIPNSHESFCLPGTNERDSFWKPEKFHYISVPYFKTGELSEFIRLPFRESRKYPEVEESFKSLRYEFEKTVKQAYGQEPFEYDNELEISRKTKQTIAAKITALKFLKNANLN